MIAHQVSGLTHAGHFFFLFFFSWNFFRWKAIGVLPNQRGYRRHDTPLKPRIQISIAALSSAIASGRQAPLRLAQSCGTFSGAGGLVFTMNYAARA